METSIVITIIVVAFLLFFLFWGIHRGFLRILLTTMALVVTVAAAGLLVPWFSGVIEKTVIGEKIESTITIYVNKTIKNPAVNSAQEVQDTVIDNLPLPKFIKTDFNKNNTPSEYIELKVTSFTDYLKNRLSTLVLNIVAYIILMILIYFLIRILLAISKAVSKVPVIGGINRVLGAVFGLIEGLLILWCLALVLMLLSGTPFGQGAMELINYNAFLKFIYDNNGILFAVNLLSHSILI